MCQPPFWNVGVNSDTEPARPRRSGEDWSRGSEAAKSSELPVFLRDRSASSDLANESQVVPPREFWRVRVLPGRPGMGTMDTLVLRTSCTGVVEPQSPPSRSGKAETYECMRYAACEGADPTWCELEGGDASMPSDEWESAERASGLMGAGVPSELDMERLVGAIGVMACKLPFLDGTPRWIPL